MIKSIVIGGSGFLGSELCNQLSSIDCIVTSIDDLSTGNHSFLSKSVQYLTANVVDSDFLLDTLNNFKPTHIFYLAALHHIPTAEADPHRCVTSNIMALSNVLSALVTYNRPISFAFASTGGVYKDLSDAPLFESSPLEPIGIYPLSKYWGEQLVSYYQQKFPDIFSCTIFRLFNLVGKNETNDHLVPAILHQLKSNPLALFHGNLVPKRDYIHVADAARAFCLWAQSKANVLPEHLNVCSGTEYSVRDVIDVCMEVSGHYPSLSVDSSRLRSYDRLHQLGSNSLLMNTLSWTVSHTLKEAVSDLWESIK